jgi:hypothetical protein
MKIKIAGKLIAKYNEMKETEVVINELDLANFRFYKWSAIILALNEVLPDIIVGLKHATNTVIDVVKEGL